MKFCECLVAPKQLGDTKWIRAGIPQCRPVPSEAYAIDLIDGSDDAPPIRDSVSGPLRVLVTNHNAGIVQNISVVLHLRWQPTKIVSRRLDFKAAQRAIDKAYVDAGGTETYRELGPNSILAEVLVLSTELCHERRPNLDVPHSINASSLMPVGAA